MSGAQTLAGLSVFPDGIALEQPNPQIPAAVDPWIGYAEESAILIQALVFFN